MVNRDFGLAVAVEAGRIRKLAGVGEQRSSAPVPSLSIGCASPQRERPQIYQISLIWLLLIWPRAIGPHCFYIIISTI